MSYLIKPKNYKPLLDLKQTELGIKQIKEFSVSYTHLRAHETAVKLVIRITPQTRDSPSFRIERDGYQ